MPKKPSQSLESKKGFVGRKPGEALAKWLNQPDLNPKPVKELLMNAQVVYRWIAEYPTLHRLNVARRQEKLPPEFWDSHQKVNEALANFAFAPQIDLHDLEDGKRVSWTLITEDNRIVIPTVQVRWLVQLIEQGAILKIRRCKQCTSWFFAHFSHQEFCKTSCRITHFAASEKFKEKRRKYMRDYYRLQRSGKVK
jgi:hypothetical protein